MRISTFLISLTFVACSTSNQQESAANITISSKGSPDRKCDRPTLEFPKQAMSPSRSKPVRTRLQFELLASGQVGTVNVKSSSGDKVLDDAAVDAARQIKCTPLPPSTPSVWLETWYEFKA